MMTREGNKADLLNEKNEKVDGKIAIHCFESTGIEGFPSNTYLANDIDSAIGVIREILGNEHSGISRILVENPKFPETTCYANISAMAPQPVNSEGGRNGRK